MKAKTTSILLLLSILIAAYVISTTQFDYDYISTVVATIVAGLGIFGVWIQLKRDANIKEAEFLMNFNFTFITTDKLVAMEQKLERCRTKGETLTLEGEERQQLIDYLVYLESFAPLVLNKMVRLDVIDDLFGYRYFIAVNNKQVQELELCPEAQYYRGCFKLYQAWKEYRKRCGLPIPMEETALDRTQEYKQYVQ